MRQYIEPQIQAIVQAINTELIEPAQRKLEEQGKAGLVVIADNLDRIANKPKSLERTVPEYLFADRGDLLNRLKCHVIYTIPLILTFSNDLVNIRNRFSADPQVLPMVRVKERDGSICEEGIDLLRRMILARAFPDVEPEQRSNHILELFDPPETLDRLCQVSGGHVRNLLILLIDCLKKDDPPFSRDLVERVISQGQNRLSQAIDADEWKLIRRVVKTQKMNEKEYEILRSSFIFEYHNDDDVWFDINPILAGAKELTDE